MTPKLEGAGEIPALSLFTKIDPEQMCENARSSLARKLPLVDICKPHGATLCIAGGGPSLEDTYKEMKGYIGAVNGSLGFLMDRGVLPNACAVVDPGPQMADIVAADPRVRYFISSICHPSLFEKLKGCSVHLWHPSGQPGVLEAIEEVEDHPLLIGGGSTMGLRWMNLGFVCGFRSFHLHGMDSSFRGDATHAYADGTIRDRIIFDGRMSTPAFLQQVADFFQILDVFNEPIKVEVFGDGLLQDRWDVYRSENPEAFK